MTEAQWKELEAAKDGGKPEKDMSLRTKVLLYLTLDQDEHPDEYNGPCLCKCCATYADVGPESSAGPQTPTNQGGDRG
jgi:hypothetical protein